MQVDLDDPARPDVVALLEEHLRNMHELSPPESVHALDVGGLKLPEITFWSVRDGETLLGCGALKELDREHGEVKSMRTPQSLRRRGAGRLVLAHIVNEARHRGYLFTPVRNFTTVDIPRIFNIAESAHRIHNPITPEKLATLGAALRLESGARLLDLGSGSGEMLCTWARDHGVVGVGIDMSQLFTEHAKRRAEELGVAHQVKFIHGDAAGYVAEEKVSVAACVGATWIAGGVVGTIELLARSLRTGGIILIGEPYWRQLPPTEEVAKGCLANSISDFLVLPELLASFGQLGYDVVEMVLADQDSWDRYEASKWLTMRRWLEANADDELAKEVRTKLASEPERYAAYTREYLGWGVFALMPR